MRDIASIEFFVEGIPKPGGSKRGFIIRRKSGRQGVSIVDACKKSKDWKALVSTVASRAMSKKGLSPMAGMLLMSVEFYLPRPKSHYVSGKEERGVRDSAPEFHTKKPDLTKLIRSTEDALTGIVWMDDSQVFSQYAMKFYAGRHGTRCGAHIYVATNNPQE